MLETKSSSSLRSIEIDEFLPTVSRWTTLGGLILLSGIGIALVLASLLKYSVTVKAPATIRPSGEVRIVQAELEGTIASIMVKENQTIQQGDVIARLDRSRLETRKNQLLSNIQQRQLQLSQIGSQIWLLDTQIAAQSQSITQEVSVAHSELDRNQREYGERKATTEADLAEAEAALQFARNEKQRYAELVNSGAVSQLQLEEKQVAVKIAEARVARAQAALSPSAASVAIAQDRIAQTVSTGQATQATLQRERAALIQQRAEIQAQQLQDQQALQQTETELQNTVIRSTSDGIVLRSNLRNMDQVVRSGDPLVEIAPVNNILIVKAKVATQDVSNVKPGQTVQLRISACPYSDYGTLKGMVTAVSPDAITPNSTDSATSTLQSVRGSNLLSYYEAIIRPDQAVFGQKSRLCQLQAGMEAEANIISRQETFLRFVLRKARLLTNL